MLEALPKEITELSAGEAEHIDGGNPLHIAAYLTGCFAAGFRFGYDVIGPAIFGES